MATRAYRTPHRVVLRRWLGRHAQGTTFGVAKTAENDINSVVPGRASSQVASSLLPSTRAAAQCRVKCLLSGCLFPEAEIGPMFLVAPLLKSNSTGLEMAPDSGPRYGPETRAGFYGFPEKYNLSAPIVARVRLPQRAHHVALGGTYPLISFWSVFKYLEIAKC